HSIVLASLCLVAALVFPPAAALAQSSPAAAPLQLPASIGVGESAQGSGPVRRLSVDEAVKLALEQNLGIQIERFNPQIDDLNIAQTRGTWAPTLTTNILNTSTDSPATSTFSGGQSVVTDGRFDTSFGVTQVLKTGANYSVSFDTNRTTSTNFFN